jgi:ATP synthase protein I
VDAAEVNRLAQLDAKQAVGFVKAQFLGSFILGAVLYLYDWTAAYSGLVGGLIAALANGWFALKVYTARGEHPAQVLRAFYWAEINKLLLTVSMFVAAFLLLKPVNAAALLAAYFFIHVTPAIMGAISAFKSRKNANERT